jgi:hypothetical protein
MIITRLYYLNREPGPRFWDEIGSGWMDVGAWIADGEDDRRGTKNTR